MQSSVKMIGALIRGVALLCALSVTVALFSFQALAADTAAPVLQKGLNLSNWLANARRQPMLERDFRQIKAAGFDHIRLPVDPDFLGITPSKNDDGLSQANFLPLDRALAWAEQNGLPTILDIHAQQSYLETLEDNGWAEKHFIALWMALAERYKDKPNNVLIFELLNEPQYYKAEGKYNDLVRRTVAAIRAVSPTRILVVGAPHGSSLESLNFLQPIDDPNIVYAFHYYQPYIITHQGIHMGFTDKMLRFFRNLPYPSSLVNQSADYYAPQAPNPAQAQKELDEYTHTPWNGEQIARRIKTAHDWAERYHVRLLCGEFGVLRNHIDPASRYRWIGDARQALEANGIGWELWDYTDLFSIAPPVPSSAPDPVDGSTRLQGDVEKGARVFEPQAIVALGLHQ